LGVWGRREVDGGAGERYPPREWEADHVWVGSKKGNQVSRRRVQLFAEEEGSPPYSVEEMVGIKEKT